MRICLVHEEYPSETNFGGIATYQKIVAEYFANNGCDVSVIARGSRDEDYYENNVHVYRVKSDNDTKSISSVIEYRAKIRDILLKIQDSIDIIETPDWGANTVLFEPYRKVPLIVRFHTPLSIWLKYNNNDFGKSKDLMLKWENKMIKNADGLTCCSSLLKNMVINEYKIKKHILVNNNPCNIKDFYNENSKNKNIVYVGSLEERKGVITLAYALNNVLDKLDSKVYIIGKDTTRNSKNISTKEYMKSIINKKYHSRINFIGQIENNEINKYLNDSYVSIIPSLFDNFPYVILEEMYAGKHIICSDNIGTVDLLKDNNLIFKSNDIEDLSNKILEFFKLDLPYINNKNIEVVNSECNPDKICKIIKDHYIKTIKEYNDYKDYEKVILNNIDVSKVLSINPSKESLANLVYFIKTNRCPYVLKRYNYNYNFDLSNELCDLYIKDGINAIKPINNKVIEYNNNKYNIFEYIKDNKSSKSISEEFILKVINSNRKTNKKSNLIDKVNKYYFYLKGLNKSKTDYSNIISIYESLKDESIFKEQYINHGDLSYSNILFYNNEYYIIDFDEAVVTTPLYDVAVSIIKLGLNKKEMNSLISKLDNYSIDDIYLVIKFYLCKILLEKFYLYEIGSIDLYDSVQIKDDYKKYVKLLEEICKK